ncbi:MAG: hypothetical protein HY939_02980, partial [Gammaproteobacteria bacterium]|nr:hypothetical protein [Gammaproteobacteria bacterium]
ILLERASAEERQQLLEQRDRLGNTAFLLAADPCGVREDVIAKFLELSSPKECLCLLKQRNNAGNTAFLLIYGHYNWGGASNAFAKLLESSLPIRKELILDYLLEGNQYDSRLTGCKFWFIYSLKRVLSAENPFQLQRADILNIVFPLLKEGLISKTGPFAFISEEQGASQFFGFFKRALNENEREKWHTRTYSLALGMLKDAYDALGNGVLDNTEEEKAFRSYVRGNNVFSLGQRATRGGMLRSTSFAR